MDVNKELTDTQQALLIKNQLAGDQDPQLQAAVSALIRQGAAVEKSPGSSTASVRQQDRLLHSQVPLRR